MNPNINTFLIITNRLAKDRFARLFISNSLLNKIFSEDEDESTFAVIECYINGSWINRRHIKSYLKNSLANYINFRSYMEPMRRLYEVGGESLFNIGFLKLLKITLHPNKFINGVLMLYRTDLLSNAYATMLARSEHPQILAPVIIALENIKNTLHENFLEELESNPYLVKVLYAIPQHLLKNTIINSIPKDDRSRTYIESILHKNPKITHETLSYLLHHPDLSSLNIIFQKTPSLSQRYASEIIRHKDTTELLRGINILINNRLYNFENFTCILNAQNPRVCANDILNQEPARQVRQGIYSGYSPQFFANASNNPSASTSNSTSNYNPLDLLNPTNPVGMMTTMTAMTSGCSGFSSGF